MNAASSRTQPVTDMRKEVARAIFGVMFGKDHWDDPLWIHAQDQCYLAADRSLAVSRPNQGDAS